MAKSIEKAQADLLSTNFLDKIGSKESFKPEKSLSAILQIAGTIVQEAQNNLNKSDRIATGKLSESLTILDPIKTGNEIVCEITALYYWKFIDKGVNGNKKSRGSQYSFKNYPPGEKMINAIETWIKSEGGKFRATGQGKTITKREKRRKAFNETKDKNSLAWAISVSIKQKGLKKTNFLTDAIKKGNSKSKELLGKALKIDILESLPKEI
jgi:hypothetical protein